jgi:hypothetical protein
MGRPTCCSGGKALLRIKAAEAKLNSGPQQVMERPGSLELEKGPTGANLIRSPGNVKGQYEFDVSWNDKSRFPTKKAIMLLPKTTYPGTLGIR